MTAQRKITAVSAFAALLSLCASYAAHAEVRTLVIDHGVDFLHPQLTNIVYRNAPEQSGTKFIDDDQNGFLDDVEGWNLVSNNADYFPQLVRDAFDKNAVSIKQILDLMTRIENGDAAAIAQVRGNAQLRQALNQIGSVSHGTHVAGIVANNAQRKLSMQSLNVFLADKPVKNEDPLDGEDETKTKMIFDCPRFVKALMARQREEALQEGQRMAEYVKAHGFKVVNLSLGGGELNITQNLNNLWEQENTRLGVRFPGRRTAAQEALFQEILRNGLDSTKLSWQVLFQSNPNVLFVVAAGNDGTDTDIDPDAGNNDKLEVYPANLSASLPNVITVAATDKAGDLADFSNTGVRTVNVAMHGKQVSSLAPGNNTVTMSGTSMASPGVAGVATTLADAAPTLSAQDLRRLLEGTVRTKTALASKVSSGGIIDAPVALSAAKRAVVIGVEAAIAEARSARSADPFRRRVLPGSLTINRLAGIMNRHLIEDVKNVATGDVVPSDAEVIANIRGRKMLPSLGF